MSGVIEIVGGASALLVFVVGTLIVGFIAGFIVGARLISNKEAADE